MGLFSSFLKQSPAVTCVLPDTHPAIRQTVSVLGFNVLASPGQWARLVPAINSAVEYFDVQIKGIPGPFDISAAQYTHHPLVHALFPGREEITHALGRSRDVKQPLAFIAGADQKEAFALLAARRTPDSQRSGELAAFRDHTLRTLAATEAGVRQGLRTAALTRLVTSFGEHLDKLRQNDKLTREQWNIGNRSDLPPADGDKGQILRAADELQPEKLLGGLIDWLQRPAEYFQVSAGEENGAAGPGVHQIDLLPRLLTRDRRKWVVCIARFPTDEGVAAIQGEPRQHRYIQI